MPVTGAEKSRISAESDALAARLSREIAGDVLASREGDRALADRFANLAMRAAARGAFPDKDLLSYLLFDAAYTNRLVDLGRADAAASQDELVRLFTD